MGALLNTVLFTDAQVEYYGEVFVRLNAQYKLVMEHSFTFDAFMTNPNERAVHQYFANKHLFVNHRFNMQVKLRTFMTSPEEILLAMLQTDAEIQDVMNVQKMMSSAKHHDSLTLREVEQHIPEFFGQFKRKHHIMLRGDRFFEPLRHHRFNRRGAH